MSSTEDGGVSVDWEMKALLVAGVYALIKVFSLDQSDLFIQAARLFFIIGHSTFLIVNSKAASRITSQNRSTEGKARSKKKCQDIMKGLVVRAAIIGFIHYKKGMLPPLIISVFMGYFSMMENGDMYDAIYFTFPKLVETFFC